MRSGFLSDSLFIKNGSEVARKNYKSIMISGIVFIAMSLIEIATYYVVDRSHVPDFWIIYDLIVASFLIFLKASGNKSKNAIKYTALSWYLIGFAFVCHTKFVHNDDAGLFNYALIGIILSMVIMMQPIMMIVVNAVGLVAVTLTDYIVHDFKFEGTNFTRHLIVFLLSIVIGIITLYLRMENLLFEKELFAFAEGEDNNYILKRTDGAWSGKNKYGILSGEIHSHRKIFTFVYNVSKETLASIRPNNIWHLENGMDWSEVKERIIETCIDPNSARRVGKFLDLDNVRQYYKAGRRRLSVVAGFLIGETEKCWFDMECTLKTHPLSGELFASVVVEDITEDRILMGILNKLVEQNYDYVMCVDMTTTNTITFKVNEGEEIKGEYGGSYVDEMNAYIASRVHGHDKTRAKKLSTLEAADDGIEKYGRHEFLVDDIDEKGILTKKLFQYSYLGPTKSFLCVTKQDVTEVINKEDAAKAKLSKALKEREEAMNTQSEFMTRMSHEMRTPMNAILGLSSLMIDEINNPKAMREYISKIQYSGEFLLQLINDVLDITKLEQEKFTLNKVPYTFSEFWEAISTMIEPMAINKGVDFEWRASIPGERAILVDPLRLTQLSINLLSNAVKYTPKGGKIVFECKEKEIDEKHSRMTLSVKDDGIGMSREFQEHMFEPFTQESKEVKNELAGTGLGLSVVKGIVDAMGGKISVKSELGHGTTFKVSFDVELAEQVEKEHVVDADVDLSGMRILVVEDNDINREIAVAVLEKRDIITETATNGQEALEKFAGHTPFYYDLILMDIRMPVMSGLTATKRIRAMERDDAAVIPIVAMTANAFSKDVAASIDAGLNEHLSKPIDPKLLYRTIGKYARKKMV